KSTATWPSAPPLPLNVIVSPTSSVRSEVSLERRSFGPWRSNSRPSRLPERSDASRTIRARRSRSSLPPCEQLTRAQSIPASTSWSKTSGGSVDGPSVATIFVRRVAITPRRLSEFDVGAEHDRAVVGQVEVADRVGGVARDRGEQLLAPAGHARVVGEHDRGARDEVGDVLEVHVALELLERAAQQR